MALQAVEAVAFWPYSRSIAKAAYGRLSGDQTYSKSYFQVPAAAQAVLDEALGVSPAKPRAAFEWRWPNGSLGSLYKIKASSRDKRGEIYIRRGPNAVRPFQLGDPSTDPSITFQGNPALTGAANATAEIERFLKRPDKGWLVAVKLVGEEGVLHARAYLDTSAASPRSLDALPLVLRDRITAGTEAGGIYFGPRPKRLTDRLADKITSVLDTEPNVLLAGPPGTGKTVTMEALANNFLADVGLSFDPDKWDENWHEVGERKVMSLVFHPSYTYERFVGGLVPAAGAGFSLTAMPGPMIQLAHWIGTSDRKALLIIDEFNRGATAAIFGDTLALLEGQKRSSSEREGASILRPYAGYSMDVGQTFKDVDGVSKVADELRLPDGLKIVAAMNSSDRLVAPLDAALRRRFHTINVPPDYDALAVQLGIPTPDPTVAFGAAATDFDAWNVADVNELATRLLMKLNDRIASLLGPDFLLGPALLWEIEGDQAEDRAHSLFDQMQARVISSLKMTFVDQDELLAAVLGVKSNGPSSAIAFLREPEEGLKTYAPPRLVWRVPSAAFDWKAQLGAMLRILGL